MRPDPDLLLLWLRQLLFILLIPLQAGENQSQRQACRPASPSGHHKILDVDIGASPGQKKAQQLEPQYKPQDEIEDELPCRSRLPDHHKLFPVLQQTFAFFSDELPRQSNGCRDKGKRYKKPERIDKAQPGRSLSKNIGERIIKIGIHSSDIDKNCASQTYTKNPNKQQARNR